MASEVTDNTLTSKDGVEAAFNRAVKVLGELFAGKQSIREVAPQTVGCERYRLTFSGARFSEANVAMADLGIAIRRAHAPETPAVATDPCRVAAAIGLLERFRDGRISSLQSSHESILGCRAQLENERDIFGYAIDALRTLPARYGVAQETSESVSAVEFDRYRRCLYRANGRLIKLGKEPEKLDYSSTHPGESIAPQNPKNSDGGSPSIPGTGGVGVIDLAASSPTNALKASEGQS